jgi:uncharacterized protein
MNILQIIYIIGGTISLAIAILGIFLPVLPATPFLLITAGLYIRSSDKLYQRLMDHKVLGPYIKNFQEKRGMPKKTKIIALIMMWTMILISFFFMLDTLPLRLTIIALGLIGSSVILFYVKTLD